MLPPLRRLAEWEQQYLAARRNAAQAPEPRACLAPEIEQADGRALREVPPTARPFPAHEPSPLQHPLGENIAG